MAELARRQAQVLVPVLLLASLALLVLLAFNLRNLDPGEETLPPPVIQEQTPTFGAREGAGDWLRNLYMTTILVIGVVIVVGSIWLYARGVKPWKLVTVWELLGYALAMAFIALLFLYWSNVHDALDAFVRWATGTRDSGGGGGTGSPPNLPVGPASTVVLFVGAAIVSVYVIVFAYAFLPRLYRVVVEQPPDVGRSKRELARAVRTAIADLEAGGEFRAAVLRCYKSMVLLFEQRGLPHDPSMTAREFEGRALRAVGVSREGIDDLTSLFEEARYSTHSIGEAQRDAAIACLTGLRRDLEGTA